MPDDDDGDHIPWRELQRRALIRGIPATLPRRELEKRLGIQDTDTDDRVEVR